MINKDKNANIIVFITGIEYLTFFINVKRFH